jgi:hypothetical protein
LIGRNKASQILGVDLPINMGDKFKHDIIHAWRETGMALNQGKFFTITSWKIVTDDLDLFFDQIEVVEQPLSRGRNALSSFNSIADELVTMPKNPFVLRKPLMKEVSTTSLSFSMLQGKSLGMILQLANAEQLSS